jgi:hypothetical protein
MTDFERRLRAAMAASAEPAPAGLLDGIHRRHQRHVRRTVTACVAAAAVVVAGTLVTREMLAGSGAAGPAGGSPALVGPQAVPSSTATAAPSTVLRDCQSNNGGTLGSHWKAQSVHAGPVWFIYARPAAASPSRRLVVGKTRASAMIVAVGNGHTAVVTAAPSLGGRFRFLAGFNTSGAPYTLSEGAPGLTLSGCPPSPIGHHTPASYAAGLTMFWEGYVTDLRGCIPVEVRTSPGSPPARVTLAAGNGGCGS